MSLRKSPSRTPVFLAANPRNAQQSTGPRTAKVKAPSRLNGLKTGVYSPQFKQLLENAVSTPPGAACQAALATMTCEQATHPVFARELDLMHWAAYGVFKEEAEAKGRRKKGGPTLLQSEPGMSLKNIEGFEDSLAKLLIRIEL